MTVEAASPRVLIVDDDPSIRRGLRSLLEDEGVDIVAEALDGVEAVNVAWQTMPDLVLMDLRMPGMGGIEATRQLTSTLPAVQVVICTAYDDASLHQGAKEAGAFAVLVKGCPPRQLLEMVDRAWAYKQELDRTSTAEQPAWTDPHQAADLHHPPSGWNYGQPAAQPRPGHAPATNGWDPTPRSWANDSAWAPFRER
jgi:DNA-binding NarL/FixJ family response regulator